VVILLHKNSFLNNKYANNNFDITPYIGGEARIQRSDGSMQKARLQPGSNMIGRNPDSNIFLDDQKLSGKHADLFVSENRYVLTDLNSRNGTKVNGQSIRQQDVYQGDEIQIGDSLIWV
jgi:pSer/pThr/pTyr-binding forkhead associated (FHA) protein